MYLSNRDIQWAIGCGKLTVNPGPDSFEAGYDETSINLHLDSVKVARIWDIDAFKEKVRSRGSHRHAELELGSFEWEDLQAEYTTGFRLLRGQGHSPPSTSQTTRACPDPRRRPDDSP